MAGQRTNRYSSHIQHRQITAESANVRRTVYSAHNQLFCDHSKLTPGYQTPHTCTPPALLEWTTERFAASKTMRSSHNLSAAETSRTKFTLHRHSLNTNSHASDNNCTRSDQSFLNHPTPSTGPPNVCLFPTQYLARNGRERDEYGTVSGHVTWRDVSKLDLSADRLAAS
jgi:hypothetical protein